MEVELGRKERRELERAIGFAPVLTPAVAVQQCTQIRPTKP